MAPSNLARFGVPFLLLAMGLATGCKSVPQPPQVTTAGLRIDVEKVSAKRERFDVRVRIWNDHEQRIAFDVANVRMIYNGREVAAKSVMWSDRTPDIQPKSNREYRWVFEVGDSELSQGSFQVEIRDIQKGDMALGETAIFTINN